MRPWTNAVLAVLVATSAVVPLTAAEGPRMGETIDVSIVNVDAVVTDKQGHPVRGLTRDDFEIYENGKQQPISNFSEFGAAPATSPDAEGRGVASRTQPRTIIVFLEHFRAPDYLRDPFFAGVRDYLHRAVRPGDAVKIVSYGKTMETRLDYTDSVASIDRTLDQIAAECGPGIDEVTFEDQLLDQAFVSSLNASNAGPLRRSGGHWADMNGNIHSSFQEEILYQSTRLPASSQSTFRFMRMRDKVAAITSLMNSIAGSDTKKIFLMGVRRFSPSGLHDNYQLDSLAPTYGWQSLNRSDAIIDYVSKTANANEITVYPLLPQGLGRDGFGLDALFDYELLNSQLPFLDEVAKETGGKLAWGPDIEKDLPEAAEDLDAYYSLGYRATNRNQDRARSIVVRPKNRNYTIRSRREYVEKSDQTRMRDRVLAALLDQPPASSMNITVDVGKPRYVSKGRYSIPVTVNIPVVALMTDGGRGQFSVFVGWSGSKGELGQVTKQSQKFKLTTNMPETFTYTFDVTADASTARLSIGVFDELSKDYGLRRVELAKNHAVAELR